MFRACERWGTPPTLPNPFPLAVYVFRVLCFGGFRASMASHHLPFPTLGGFMVISFFVWEPRKAKDRLGPCSFSGSSDDDHLLLLTSASAAPLLPLFLSIVSFSILPSCFFQPFLKCSSFSSSIASAFQCLLLSSSSSSSPSAPLPYPC